LAGTNSNTSIGWAAGGGFELALWSNTTIKFEYLHIDLGDQTIKLLPSNGSTGTAYAFAKFDNAFDLVRVGMNYRF